MQRINYKEASRLSWSNLHDSNYPGSDLINMGSLQRIADATEMMTKNYIDLQRNYDYMKSDRDNLRERYREMERKLSALKGVITKLKAKKIMTI